MRKLTITLFFLSILTAAYSQHCPFDGSAAVVIRVLNSKGRMVNNPSYSFVLVETDTAKADSCTYAQGPLHIPFGTIQQSLIKKYNGGWESRAAVYVKETSFSKPGYQVVVLNQAQTSCMLKRDNGFDYFVRKFEVQVRSGGKIKSVVPVLPDKIYELCTSAGKWSRIIPVDITLPD